MIFSGLSDIINFFSMRKNSDRDGCWPAADNAVVRVWLIVRPIAFETLLVAIPFVFSDGDRGRPHARHRSIELKGLDVRVGDGLWPLPLSASSLALFSFSTRR
jgi:hypothetical protein